MVIIKRRPIKHAANKKDIISQHEEDLMSRLPSDILISIITRLEMKFAVRTSILSKRWRNLYKLVPDVYFREEEHSVTEVERFLRLRCYSKIHSFHWRCLLTKSSCVDGFEHCIFSLGRLGVEELVVYFPKSSHLISFSCHLLSEMPSIKYFQLASCSLEPNLKTQHNSLQTLSLVDVTLLPSALECVLLNCLKLHSLIIDRCDCPSKLCFCGPNLQVKSLKIRDCEGVDEIELYASNLMTFEFHHHELVDFLFDHVPQLQTMHLCVENDDIMPYVLGELAKDLPHLKSLALSTQHDFDHESMKLKGMRIETFNNLRRLELKVYYTFDTSLLALTPFLESCAFLQEFHLDIPYDLEHDGGGSQVQSRQRVVLHSELKKVAISGFSGTEDEMEFALYILKSAVKLEQMRINWRSKCHPNYYDMRDITPRIKMIEKQLQEQALSEAAQVIVRYALISG